MTPGIAYALTVFAALDGSPPAAVTWHATLQACRAHIAVEVTRQQAAGRPVAWADCERARIPRAIRGETR